MALGTLQQILLRFVARTPIAMRAIAALGLLGLSLAAIEPLLPSPFAPRIHVRWNDALNTAERQRLESTFRLEEPQHLDGTTWRYDLADITRANVAALVAHRAVLDTHEINRDRAMVSPGAPRGDTWIRSRALHFWQAPRIRRVLVPLSAAAAFLPVAWPLGLTLLAAARATPLPRWDAAAILRAMSLVAIAWPALIAAVGGANVIRAAAAGLAVYLFGYVTGALLVPPREDDTTLSLSIVRTIVGLLLSTVCFLLCLRLSLPWAIGPAVLLLLTAIVYGRAALTPPRPTVAVSWDGIIAGLIAIVAIAPFVVAAIRMSPGPFPPMFFNVDTPYFLGHVHSLVTASTYPPESLSFTGGRRAYHYGTHALAALISRSSGLRVHHTVFLLVMPLLTIGIVAAAVVLARRIARPLPWVVTIPMLLVAVPKLWYSFWSDVGPRLMTAASSFTLAPVAALLNEPQLWGVTFNNGHDLMAHLLLLVCVAAIAAAPDRGWRLPVFVAGVAFLFRAPTGVSVLAGFGFMSAARAAFGRNLRALTPALAALAVFAAVYVIFWASFSGPSEFTLEVAPLFQLTVVRSRLGFVTDIIWLILPALVVATVRPARPDTLSVPLLLFALAPLLVVNTIYGSTYGVAEDWLQILMAVPLLLHAFALSVAGLRWERLGDLGRAAFLCAVALVSLPPLAVSARYAAALMRDPQRGHEFADNRALGAALAVIPPEDTIVVTNDLRYPANGFRRDNRQMQIPALFGHQAFAVNYAYESYPFSEERQTLQALLRAPAWSVALEESAQRYGWTHLVVHKHYPHPATIPLERLFENSSYVVYRFTLASHESAIPD